MSGHGQNTLYTLFKTTENYEPPQKKKDLGIYGLDLHSPSDRYRDLYSRTGNKIVQMQKNTHTCIEISEIK